MQESSRSILYVVIALNGFTRLDKTPSRTEGVTMLW